MAEMNISAKQAVASAPLDQKTVPASAMAIALHQQVSNAISTAQWHLAQGRINEAAGRILSAARNLSQISAEPTTQGRA